MDNKGYQHPKKYHQSLLWQRLCEGDERALSELYKQHYQYLYNYGRKLLNNDEVVEDAIHDVFATIWHSRKRLNPITSVSSYLVVSLRHRLLRLKKKEEKEFNLDTDNIETYPDIQFSSLDIMIASENNTERKKIVIEAINMLPAQKREVIYLHFVNGMDYEEISDIMDISVHTARNYTSDALTRLKKIILDNIPHISIIVYLLAFLFRHR